MNLNVTPLYFTKTRHVKNPVRGTPKSAGIDFFVPEFDQKFIDDLVDKNPTLKHSYIHRYLNDSGTIDLDKFCKDGIIVSPSQRILIPSGIHVRIPEGYALIAHNKSGVATKQGFDRLAEVIDEDYQGEIHLSVVNTGFTSQRILPGQKLIQCILIPVLYSEPLEMTTLKQLYPIQTERGEGGFGSTGH